MPDEIKKCPVTHYELTTRFYESYIKEAKDGDYVAFEDYESLRRSSISLETAQELADCLKMYLCQCECCAGKLDSREREALSRLNAEKGGA